MKQPKRDCEYHEAGNVAKNDFSGQGTDPFVQFEEIFETIIRLGDNMKRSYA